MCTIFMVIVWYEAFVLPLSQYSRRRKKTCILAKMHINVMYKIASGMEIQEHVNLPSSTIRHRLK